jgi:hypothetical protein
VPVRPSPAPTTRNVMIFLLDDVGTMVLERRGGMLRQQLACRR